MRKTIILMMALLLVMPMVLGVGDDETLNMELWDDNSNPLNATINVTINFYAAQTGGNTLHNSTITNVNFTNGFASLIVSDLNLTFNPNHYWIGLDYNGTGEKARFKYVGSIYRLNQDQYLAINGSASASSSNVFATMSDLISDTDTHAIASGSYLYNDSTTITFNETVLNTTIDARDSDTTYTTLGVYLILSSTQFSINETKLNDTIDDRDSDTTYNSDETYIYESVNVFNMNETKLNISIFNRINGSNDITSLPSLNINESQVTDLSHSVNGTPINVTTIISGLITITAGTGNIVGNPGAGSSGISITDVDGTGGVINFNGNTAAIGVSSDGVVGGYNYNGAYIFRQKASNPTEVGEFIFIEESGDWRFALPASGAGYGTYNPRSLIVAGPSVNNASNFDCSYWGFNAISCNTGANGADVGIQNNLQVLNTIFSGNWSNVSITELQISDLSHTTDTTIGNCSGINSCNNIIYSNNASAFDNKITSSIGNISSLISSFKCTGSDQLTNVSINGSGVQGVCSSQGAGGSFNNWTLTNGSVTEPITDGETVTIQGVNGIVVTQSTNTITINTTIVDTNTQNSEVTVESFIFDSDNTGDMTTTGTLNTSNISITSVLSCSQALETDASGTIICGTDETGAGGENFWINDSNGYLRPNASYSENVNITGDLIVGNETGDQILGVEGSSLFPTYSFIDGTNAGFYFDNTFNRIRIAIDGTGWWTIDDSFFAGGGTRGAFLKNAIPSASAATFAYAGDLDTGMFSPGADETCLSAGSIEFYCADETTQDESIFNDDGVDIDFRVETANFTNTFFVEGATDKIGIGTISPTQKLDVNGSINVSGVYYGNGSQLTGITHTTDTNETTRVDLLITANTTINSRIDSVNTTANIEGLNFTQGAHTTDTHGNLNITNTSNNVFVDLDTGFFRFLAGENISSIDVVQDGNDVNITINAIDTDTNTQNSEATVEGFIFDADNTGDMTTTGDIIANYFNGSWNGSTLYYLITQIDTQGEMETIWGVTLATDAELAAQDECSEITNCVPNAWDANADISADEISESKIAFSTACAAGNHYYLNGNDLACEADANTQLSEAQVEAMIFDNDNTANLNMSSYNVTSVTCLKGNNNNSICFN